VRYDRDWFFRLAAAESGGRPAGRLLACAGSSGITARGDRVRVKPAVDVNLSVPDRVTDADVGGPDPEAAPVREGLGRLTDVLRQFGVAQQAPEMCGNFLFACHFPILSDTLPFVLVFQV
jgi:hypothetical protein